MINSKLKTSDKRISELRQEIVNLKRLLEVKQKEPVIYPKEPKVTVAFDTKEREQREEELKQLKKQLRLVGIA